MEELLEELKEYFANLLIIQYRGAERNRNLIKFLVDLIFANNLALKVKEETVSINSIGAQLDVVGKWVGVDRYYLQELWNRIFLALPNYETIKDSSYTQYQGGLSDYTTFDNNDGGVVMYKDWQAIRGKVNELGDDLFKKLIELKIIKNSLNHTCKNIDDAIYSWSEGNVYTTWGKPVYEPTSFVTVGSPTVTQDGIASDFSNSKYLYSNSTLDCNKPFKVVFNEKRGTATKFNGFGLGTYSNRAYSLFFVQSANTTNITFGLYINGTLAKTEINNFVHSNYTDINYIVSWDRSTYILTIVDATTSKTLATLSYKSIVPLYRNNTSIGVVVYGHNFNSGYSIQSTDLKKSYVISENQVIFRGANDEPMNMIYHYTSEYKTLIEIAEFKNVLPKPSGCNIILEGI